MFRDLTHEERYDGLSQYVGTNCHSVLCKKSQKNADLKNLKDISKKGTATDRM
jgi:hypothetical protein